MTKIARLTARADSRGDLTSQLITRFKNLIAQGILIPGAKLPPERELAPKFGVSRSSLRHALKVLDSMGVVRQRVGDGTYLNNSAAQIFSQPLDFLVLLDSISLFELLETRLIVEPELAARAAERAVTENLDALRNSLTMMAKETDHRKLVELDIAFHQEIFRASGNRLCGHIFTLIHRSMITSIKITSQIVDWNHTLAFHRPIYEAIFRRQPKAAHDRMVDHLSDAKDLLVRAALPTRGGVSFSQVIRPVRRPAGASSRLA